MSLVLGWNGSRHGGKKWTATTTTTRPTWPTQFVVNRARSARGSEGRNFGFATKHDNDRFLAYLQREKQHALDALLKAGQGHGRAWRPDGRPRLRFSLSYNLILFFPSAFVNLISQQGKICVDSMNDSDQIIQASTLTVTVMGAKKCHSSWSVTLSSIR